MKAKKVAVICLTLAMTIGMLGGCGSSEKSEGETTGEQITLNYWTWFPSKDQIQETVDAFEKENPDIKINMTVMESKAFQEKVPLALSTEEDIDVIGVQPSAFAEEVQDYLADLDELMPEAAGEDWKELYSEKCLEQGNQLTGGDTKMLVLTNSGSMVGFYNAALLKEIGYEAMLRIWDTKKRPTAIFISNYDMTIGAYLAINYLNLKIPDDISVIGFDNFPLANVVNPPLSFAEQPTNEMGTEAGKLLYKRICGDYSDYPQTIMHKPTMYYKESIRKIN